MGSGLSTAATSAMLWTVENVVFSVGP